MFPLRILLAHYERVMMRSLPVPATSCLMTLGCALARMLMVSACLERLQGITPGDGDGCGKDGASFPQWWWPGCCHCDLTAKAASAAAVVSTNDDDGREGAALLPRRVRGSERSHQLCRGCPLCPP